MCCALWGVASHSEQQKQDIYATKGNLKYSKKKKDIQCTKDIECNLSINFIRKYLPRNSCQGLKS